MTAVGVAVVDDDYRVCRAVARTLSTEGYRVSTFTSAGDYLAARPSLLHTCLVADIVMPQVDGIAMHCAGMLDGRAIPTVFMTATRDVSTLVAAMKSGAADLLPKPFTSEELIEAVSRALRRARHARRRHRQLAMYWQRAVLLTRREAEVAAMVASGRSNKKVAAAIGVSERTVKVHRGRAMKKLEAPSLAQLVRIVDQLLGDETLLLVPAAGQGVPRPDVIAHMLAILLVHGRPR